MNLKNEIAALRRLSNYQRVPESIRITPNYGSPRSPLYVVHPNLKPSAYEGQEVSFNKKDARFRPNRRFHIVPPTKAYVARVYPLFLKLLDSKFYLGRDIETFSAPEHWNHEDCVRYYAGVLSQYTTTREIVIIE